MFWNGSTAMDGLSGNAEAVAEDGRVTAGVDCHFGSRRDHANRIPPNAPLIGRTGRSIFFSGDHPNPRTLLSPPSNSVVDVARNQDPAC